jgi:hypothetical protein
MRFVFQKYVVSLCPDFMQTWTNKGQSYADKKDIEFAPQIVPHEIEKVL